MQEKNKIIYKICQNVSESLYLVLIGSNSYQFYLTLYIKYANAPTIIKQTASNVTKNAF